MINFKNKQMKVYQIFMKNTLANRNLQVGTYPE